MNEVIINQLNESYLIKSSSVFDLFIDDKIKKNNTDILVYDNQDLLLNIIDFSSYENEFNINLDLNLKSSLNLNLISVVNKNNKKRFNIKVNHNNINGYSRIRMSGINLGGDLIFNGEATIFKGSKKTDTKIEGKITNLDPLAKSDVSPKLFIKENDIKASHGASLGSYDEKNLFYLTSRGISLKEAKSLIIYGTLLPLLSSIKDKNLYSKSLNYLKEFTL